MAKYEKFEEWMIGERVTHVRVKSSGVIVERPAEDDPNICVNVKYDEGDLAGETIGAFLRNLEFLEEVPYKEEKAIPWQVGQVVWDVVEGKGIVADVDYGERNTYPVKVVYDGDGGYDFYTLDGKLVEDDKIRRLYFSEPKIVAETMPPKKPFVPKLKEGDKIVLSDREMDYITTVVSEDENSIYYRTEDGVVTFVEKGNSVSVYKLGEEIKWD